MNIIFDKTPGEIFDVFLSLWLLNNYEYANEEKKYYGLTKNTKFEEKINTIRLNEKSDIKNIERYFFKEIEPHDMFTLKHFWGKDSINEYLDFLKKCDEYSIRKKIIKIFINEEANKEDIVKLAFDNSSVLNYIKDQEINESIKWQIFCLLDNKEKYLDEFKRVINEYTDTYKGINKERKKDIDKFNKQFEKNINERGIDFLKEITNDFIDYENFENIYISSSAAVGLTVDENAREKVCYVLLGPQTKEIVKNVTGKNRFEKNLTVFKNISDNTRFRILKKLLHKDHFGLEIAEALGLSKATVSHHMSYLLLSGVVNIERKDRKAYYSLNKEKLRKSIDFLYKELEL